MAADARRKRRHGTPSFWISVLVIHSVLVTSVVLASSARVAGAWWWVPLGVVLIGWLQYVLIQAMHEACHQVCDGLPGWLAGVLLFNAFGLSRSYRKIHLAHHRHFNSTDDPDGHAYLRFPSSRLELMSILGRHLSGWAAVRQLVDQSVGQAGQKHAGSPLDRFAMPLTQLVILGAFTLLSGPQDYVLFWLLPLFTVVKLLGYLRILAEHADPERGPILRSFRCGAAGRILGPYGFTRHAEHHAYAAVPFELLHGYEGDERRHVIEAYAGARGVEVEIFEGSHFTLLARWWRQLPLSPGV